MCSQRYGSAPKGVMKRRCCVLAGDKSVDAPLVWKGNIVYGERADSLWYEVRAAKLGCSWKKVLPFCPLPVRPLPARCAERVRPLQCCRRGQCHEITRHRGCALE